MLKTSIYIDLCLQNKENSTEKLHKANSDKLNLALKLYKLGLKSLNEQKHMIDTKSSSVTF